MFEAVNGEVPRAANVERPGDCCIAACVVRAYVYNMYKRSWRSFDVVIDTFHMNIYEECDEPNSAHFPCLFIRPLLPYVRFHKIDVRHSVRYVACYTG